MKSKILTAFITLFSSQTATAADLIFEGGGQRMVVSGDTIPFVELLDLGEGLARVDLVLSPDDRQRFADLTRDLIGEQLTVSVCGIVVAEPHVMDAITGGQIAITGGSEMMADVKDALTAAQTHNECAEFGS